MNRITSANHRSARSAFTLLELLLVLAILLVIAGLVVPKLSGRQKAANVDATRISIEGLKQAVKLYEIDHEGEAPTTSDGLAVLTKSTKNDPNWRGPYLEKPPVDAWGKPFQYRRPGTNGTRDFDIVSAGPDHVFGNEDDIVNQE